MPSPISVSVKNITNPLGGPLFIPRGGATNISMICSVTLNRLVNIPVTVTYTWIGKNYIAVKSIAHADSTESNNTITIYTLTLEDAGAYTCRVDVNSTNPFIDGTGTSMNTTNVALCKLEMKLVFHLLHVMHDS